MTLRTSLRSMLLLLLLLALGACTPTRGGNRGGSSDDDDAANDDDAADDDDSVANDDDSVANDDDSVANDDDSVGDDDDSVPSTFAETTFSGSLNVTGGGASGTFVVRYWENLDAQILGCAQTINWNGTANFGFSVLAPDCDVCTGSISVNINSVNDVSDPSVNPDDCSETNLSVDAAENWGDRFTHVDGGSAWPAMPLMDLDTAEGLGFQATSGAPLQDTVDGLANSGLELTHIGFVYLSTTIFGAQGFDLGAAGANPPETGADMGAFWTVFKDPNANTWSDPYSLSGDYFLGSFWLLN